jgi:DNA invertase Pin-like site-specific DNA recombinase
MPWKRSPLIIDPSDGLRAAQYVRMSTDDQKYSTENQATAIAAYADQRHLLIVRTYLDNGKSGLRISNRKGLQILIEDIEEGRADFGNVLIYDISRWGRFQDVDESAHYEFLCRRAGVRVHYCEEQFENDGSLVSAIMKNIKRVAAADYSRDLSAKVFAGSCRIARLGFKQGGVAGFGLQRVLLDQSGFIRCVLARGDRKALTTDRVVLQPGRPDEVKTVRRVFRSFVVDHKSEYEIANALNAEGILNEFGRPWKMLAIRRLLQCEKYLGNYVYNHKSRKLKGRTKQNPPEQWVRCDGAFESIISVALFEKAGQIIEGRPKRTKRASLPSGKMLSRLKSLLQKKKHLSARIIERSPDTPCHMTYIQRFGSLRRAYELIGYRPDSFKPYDGRKAATATIAALARDLVARIQGAEVAATFDGALYRLTIGTGMTLSILIARCQTVANGVLRWPVRRRVHPSSDLVLLVRIQQDNATILDYFVVPKARFPTPGLWSLRKKLRADLELYRMTTLDGAVAAVHLHQAARERVFRTGRKETHWGKPKLKRDK